MTSLPRSVGLVLALVASLAVGCNSGSRSGGSSKANFGPGSGQPATATPPGGTTPPPVANGLTYATVQLAAAQTSQLISSNEIVALVFTLTTTSAAVDVSGVSITNTGTVDESATVMAPGTATLWLDVNNDGILQNATDTQVATATQPAANNGPYVFTAATAATIPATSTAQFLVSVNGSATVAPTNGAQLALQVGVDLELAVAAATDITSTATTVTGGFLAPNPPATLGVGTHLLISEVLANDGGAGDAEFIEIYNPTGATITLTNYHLTDTSTKRPGYPNAATGTNVRYWYLPIAPGTAPSFGPSNAAGNSDFQLRFPDAATIASGAAQTIAINQLEFNNAYPAAPTYYIIQGPTAGAGQMRTWDGVAGQNFVASATQGTGNGLTNGGEGIMLFTWDGALAPDLVTDVDYVFYGAEGNANQAIDKTGEMVNVSTFVNETTNLNFPAAPGAGTSIQRTDWTESGETKTGGNGVGGHSEVSENHAAAWTVATETPGTIP